MLEEIAAGASLINTAAKLFGGSGKTPAVLQGFNVQGTFGPSGFSGAVTAGDQKGDRWTATGEQAYLNGLGRGLLTVGVATENLTDADIDRYFAEGGAPIPVNVSTGSDNSTLARSVADSIIGAIKSASSVNALLNQVTTKATTMQAPDLAAAGAATPPGTPISQPAPSAADVTSAVTSALDVSSLTSNPLVLLAGLALVAWLILRKKG